MISIPQKKRVSKKVPASWAFFLVLLLICTTFHPACAGSPGLTVQKKSEFSGKNLTQQYKDGELIVRFKPSVSREPEVLKKSSERMIEILLAMKKGTGRPSVMGDLSTRGLPGVQLVRLPEGVDVREAVAVYSKDPDVLYAEPNYKRLSEKIPTDPRFKDQWGLYNTGQFVYDTTGLPGSDIRAPEAWDTTTGSKNVIIAVLDPAGVQVSHPDLAANIWNNTREISGNGVDDDGNGYIDDINGWDFYDTNYDYRVDPGEGDNDPSPDHFTDDHGTSCAGVIGAAANNGVGIAGTMWDVTIMPLKFDGDTWSESAAILYARQNGARVISCSFGNYDYSQIEQDAIRESPGLLFVCSAGNDGLNTDISQHYPSGYPDENLISVASSDQRDGIMKLWTGGGSNYGPVTVDLAAPGANILCIAPDGSFIYGDGTSLSTPYVAAVAGLILSIKPEATSKDLKDAILNSVDPLVAFADKTVTEGRLDAASALMAVDTTPRPDIVITTVDSPGSVLAGADMTIKTTVRNTGRADAGQVEITYYMTKALMIGEQDSALGTYSVHEIAAGETVEITPVFRVPDNTTMGRYYIFARADEAGKIHESNERNNIQFDATALMISVRQSPTPTKTPVQKPVITFTKTPVQTKTPLPTVPRITVSRTLSPTGTPAGNSQVQPSRAGSVMESPPGVPDVGFSSLGCPDRAVSGRILTVTYFIANSGGAPSRSFNVDFFLSVDRIPDSSDFRLGNQYIPMVKRNTSLRQSIGFALPKTLGTGDFFLIAVADSSGTSGETNTDNNIIVCANSVSINPLK